MILNLTTWQRVNCINIVGAIGGASASVFRNAARLLDILEMTDTEEREVGFINETDTFKGSLSSLEGRFGIKVENAWLAGEEALPLRDPNDVFFLARVPIGRTLWKDKEHLFSIEIADKNLVDMLKSQIAAYSWPQGELMTKKRRVQIINLLDQLGIE